MILMIEVLISNKSNYLLFLICYFIGSIPFGYIFYKIIKKDDIEIMVLVILELLMLIG